jgi:hypothetical protein
MKKFLLFLLCTIVFGLGINSKVFAKDVIPVRPDIANVPSIGLYQVGDDVVVYSEPDENSQILYRVRWNSDEFFPEEIGFEKFFEVFLPKKNLALVRVNDYLDDWVEIFYDKTKNKTGWIKKDDPYKFMTWINFYNVYGKKYGLTLLKSAPESCLEIKSATEDNAKTISTINHPQQINLNVIRGNWALVSVLDLDKAPKTGYIRWRSDDGVRYFFPSVR